MNGNFLKRMPIIVVALTTFSSIFAATDTESRLKQLEQQMKQIRVETATGTYGARTASARPEVDGAGASFSVDALLWKANVGGADYIYTDSSPDISFPVIGSMQYPNFDWDWGVRVGVGYNFLHDNWESNLVFTYFSSDGNDSIQAGAGSSLIPIKGELQSPKGVDQGRSRIKFLYDNLDLELGRNYFFSRSLSLKSYFGLKNTWLNLKETVQYSGDKIVDYVFLNKGKSKFWGIGPNIGVNAKWCSCSGFGLFGNIGGSLLWSYLQVKNYELLSLDPAYINNSIRANAHKFIPTAEVVMGLSYDSYMFDNKQHLNISLGWDTIYYWRANQTLKIEDFASGKYSRVSEDVSMQGFTFHVRLDF